MDCPKCTSATWCLGFGDKPGKGIEVVVGHVYVCTREGCDVGVVRGIPGSSFRLDGQEFLIWRDGVPRRHFNLPLTGGWPSWRV